jgi:hypothetical protein
VSRFLACFIATHACICPSDVSTVPREAASTTYGMLPYRSRKREPIASVPDLVPIIFGAGSLN